MQKEMMHSDFTAEFCDWTTKATVSFLIIPKL